jgi:hypothetical protein
LASVNSIRLAALASLLSLSSGTAQAKSHLSSDELKILAGSSVALVYVDTDQVLQPYLDPNHRMLGITPATMIVADVVNQHRLNAFAARIAPYRAALDGFSLSQSTHKAVRDALTSIPWLVKTPWVEARQDPQDYWFMRKHAELARTQVVIFIHPQLMMDPSADELFVICDIDVETANPPGANIVHYESIVVTTSLDIDDDELPPRTTPPKQGEDDAEVRLARMFADDGAAFKKLYDKAVAKTQQQLYYYFTGNDTPPPAAATVR